MPPSMNDGVQRSSTISLFWLVAYVDDDDDDYIIFSDKSVFTV